MLLAHGRTCTLEQFAEVCQLDAQRHIPVAAEGLKAIATQLQRDQAHLQEQQQQQTISGDSAVRL
jgi:hypothetical protein